MSAPERRYEVRARRDSLPGIEAYRADQQQSQPIHGPFGRIILMVPRDKQPPCQAAIHRIATSASMGIPAASSLAAPSGDGPSQASLKRWRPSIPVELENCRNPGSVATVHAYMTSLGYGCWFFKNNQLHPYGDINEAQHRNKANPKARVRNFLHLTPATLERVRQFIGTPS